VVPVIVIMLTNFVYRIQLKNRKNYWPWGMTPWPVVFSVWNNEYRF